MAELVLRDRLATRGVEASVSSAGLALAGEPASDEVIELMRARGLDASNHASRLLHPALLSSTDLVLGMARLHVREVGILDAAAFRRTFTLKELVRLASEQGPRPSDLSFPDWLATLADARAPLQHLGASPDDDIDDPMGRRMGIYKRVALEIEQLVDELVALAWPMEQQPADRAAAAHE
jgi:protein-tyrosine phosphatase